MHASVLIMSAVCLIGGQCVAYRTTRGRSWTAQLIGLAVGVLLSVLLVAS